jgi:8-oxo-dGTP pyrophosphatase MutT (NUDIX family)
MGTGDRSTTGRTLSAKSFRPSHLRKLRGSEQVAAVCYRLRGTTIEFLLVQTRGSGRWTFPKGGVEAGLTHAQLAALEAFEEAGVHGRMEEESFARYTRRKRSAAMEIVVHAHLCEVSRLVLPLELRRNPTWFSPEKTKQRLQQDRTPGNGAEFARVVDRAVARIQRLRNPICTAAGALQKVQLEARPETGIHARIEEVVFAQYIRGQGGARRSPVIELAANGQPCKVLQLGPALNQKRRLLEEHTPDYEAGPAPTAQTKSSGTGKKSSRSAS